MTGARSRHNGTRVLIALALAVLCLGGYKYWRSPARGLPYVDSFATGKAAEWKAFGGTWELSHGSMHNDSDERGAKLMTGSVDWENYSIEADMMLLGLGGDAGLLVRSSHEEEGVDAYEGYYAGLRTVDNALALGRAGYGWMEVSFPLKTVPIGVQASHWYHLKLLAYGCRLAASAGLVGQANPTGWFPSKTRTVFRAVALACGRIHPAECGAMWWCGLRRSRSWTRC